MKLRAVPEDYFLALVRLWHLHDALEREVDNLRAHEIRDRIAEMDDQVDEIRLIRADISDAIRWGLEGK